MNKRIFHKSLYKDQLKQLRLIGAIGLALLSLCAILLPVGRAISIAQSHSTDINAYMGRTSIEISTSHIYLYFIFIVLVPLLTLACFHYLTGRNSSDFYHSIPHTRTCVYTCSIAAIFTWATILVWVPTLLSFLVYTILNKYFVIELVLLLRFALFIYVASLLVAAAISIACSLTGTVFTNVIVAGLILFLPRIFILVLSQMIAGSSVVLVGSHLFPLLDFQYNIIFGLLLSIMRHLTLTWGGLLYSTILMVLYLVIGLFVFKGRRSEAANQAAVSRKVQTGIRLILGMAVSLIPLSLLVNMITRPGQLDSSEIPIFIYTITILYLLACLVMLLYELLTTKKFKNVVKALPSIGILAILNLALLLGSFGIFKGLMSYQPETNEIDYFVMEQEYSTESTRYYDTLTSTIQIDDANAKDVISRSLKENIKDANSNIDLSFTNDRQPIVVGIHSGLRTHYRRLWVTEADYTTLMKVYSKSKDYVAAYQALPELSGNRLSLYSLSLEDKEYLELYNIAREEIASLPFDTWYQAVYNGSNTSLDTIVFYTTVNQESLTGTIPITALLPKTCQKYIDYTGAKGAQEQSTIRTTIKDILGNRMDEYEYYNVNYHILDLETEERYYFDSYTDDRSNKTGKDYALTEPGLFLTALASDTKEHSSFDAHTDYVVNVYLSYYKEGSNGSVSAASNFIIEKAKLQSFIAYLNDNY